MRLKLVFWSVTALALCIATASCTLITEVDRGLIGAGGMGGAEP